MKTLIKNGLIMDGTGTPGYPSDLLIQDDTIVRIAKDIQEEGCQVIDAAGCVVCPGFIDTHSHSDLLSMTGPEITPKIMQGVTSEVVGQDGVGMAPLPPQFNREWRKNIEAFEGDSDDVPWDRFTTTEGYLDEMEKVGPGVNLAALVPHGNIRMEAMGLENRLPTDAEMDRMRDIMAREMEAGAFGISTGLIYMPCNYAATEELIELCKVAAKYDGVFVTHQRSEADDILPSMEETLRIGRESGIRVHFSHFKVCGKNNWDKVDKAIELLEKAKAEGLTVSFDEYPYVAGCTMLSIILPPWVGEGGNAKALERLRDADLRKRMIADIQRGIPGWDNFIDFAGLDGIIVTGVSKAHNQEAVGKSLTELGKLRGTDPYNAVFDLLLDEDNNVSMVDFYGKEEHIEKFISRPEMNVCTDGCVGEAPHPRMYGSFARVLGRYAREKKIITMEQAVQKMTKTAAAVCRLEKRGELKEGYFADVVVFDPETVIDKGTFENAAQHPEGIKYVFVNGGLTVDNGRHTHRRTGRILRKK